ncbi:TPA: hypothetical protein ACH3X1_014635 [Trebouxia sp. C0004]
MLVNFVTPFNRLSSKEAMLLQEENDENRIPEDLTASEGWGGLEPYEKTSLMLTQRTLRALDRMEQTLKEGFRKGALGAADVLRSTMVD